MLFMLVYNFLETIWISHTIISKKQAKKAIFLYKSYTSSKDLLDLLDSSLASLGDFSAPWPGQTLLDD